MIANNSINSTETTFRNLTENQELLKIDKILKINVEGTKRQLQQRKFKKFNHLKYKPQPIKNQTSTTSQANFKKSSANAFQEPFFIKLLEPGDVKLRRYI